MASQEGHAEVVQLLLAKGGIKQIAKAHAIAKLVGHAVIVDILAPLLPAHPSQK